MSQVWWFISNPLLSTKADPLLRGRFVGTGLWSLIESCKNIDVAAITSETIA
jgi:hypothetical protein